MDGSTCPQIGLGLPEEVPSLERQRQSQWGDLPGLGGGAPPPTSQRTPPTPHPPTPPPPQHMALPTLLLQFSKPKAGLRKKVFNYDDHHLNL